MRPARIDGERPDCFLDRATGAAYQYPAATITIDVTYGERHLWPRLELEGRIHALETLRETGSARPIARMLKEHMQSTLGPRTRCLAYPGCLAEVGCSSHALFDLGGRLIHAASEQVQD